MSCNTEVWVFKKNLTPNPKKQSFRFHVHDTVIKVTEPGGGKTW